MIRLEDYKKALGPQGEQLSEKEIVKLRDQDDQIAEILFSIWLADIKEKKYN